MSKKFQINAGCNKQLQIVKDNTVFAKANVITLKEEAKLTKERLYKYWNFNIFVQQRRTVILIMSIAQWSSRILDAGNEILKVNESEVGTEIEV